MHITNPIDEKIIKEIMDASISDEDFDKLLEEWVKAEEKVNESKAGYMIKGV